MWAIIGSDAFVTFVLVAVAAAWCNTWWRADRPIARGAVAFAGLVVITVIALLVSWLPVSANGVGCVADASPWGVNLVEIDSATARQMEITDRFGCRTAARTRYLLILGGYLLATAVVLMWLRRSKTPQLANIS